MIEGVQVKNYKSLKNIDVELGDFTVLVGPNNSGKSALLEAIMYLKSAFENPVQNANHFENIPYLDHSINSDVVSYRDNGNQADFISVNNLINFSDTAQYEELEHFYDELEVSTTYPTELYIGAELYSNEWYPVVKTKDGSQILEGADSDHGGITLYDGVTGSENMFHDNSVWSIEFGSGKPHVGDIVSVYESILSENLAQIYYLTDNREISEWASDPEELDFVGHSGENTVAMLHALRDDPETFNRIKQAISDISSDVADLRADMDGANTQTELEDADTEELINIVASGAGLRRLLPIIVQIGAADAGDTILVEEPEISVYPETQERLVEFMLESARERDIQIIFTTHGHSLIWKVQNMAKSSDGHCLVFEKEDGESKVEKRPLDRIPADKYYGEE